MMVELGLLKNLDICLLEHPAIKLRLILAILINNNTELHQISEIQELVRILGYKYYNSK